MIFKVLLNAPKQHYKISPQWGFFGVGLSKLYALMSALNQKWRQSRAISLPAHCPPIISIGNLTTGGTGKTPVVIALAQYYESLGMRCLILTRGYGGKPRPDGAVLSSEQGDEPWLIQSQLKHSIVLANPDRVLLLNLGLASKPDVILLDDGYQYLQLPRHLNILLVDGERGFGNEYLLPAGPLRESLSTIKRADVVLLTKQINAEIKQRVEKHLYGQHHFIPVLECPFEQPNKVVLLGSPIENQQTQDWQDILPKTVIGVITGIAQPEDFIQTLESNLKRSVSEAFIYPDHAHFSNADITLLLAWLNEDSQRILITTEKDAVKLAHFEALVHSKRVWVQPIAPIFPWQTITESKQLQLLKQYKPSFEFVDHAHTH